MSASATVEVPFGGLLVKSCARSAGVRLVDALLGGLASETAPVDDEYSSRHWSVVGDISLWGGLVGPIVNNGGGLGKREARLVVVE